MITELFKEDTDYSSEYIDDIQEIELEEFAEDPIIGSLAIAIHMEAATAKLNEAVGIMELQAVQESGSTVIYESEKGKERIKSWFNGAIAWLKRMAGYIKAFFKKGLAMLSNIFATDAKWISSNKKYILSAENADSIEFEGYDYSIPSVIGNASSVVTSRLFTGSDAEKYIDDYENNKSNWLEKARNEITGISGLDSDKELRNKLAEKMKGIKKSLTVSSCYGNTSKLISIIENGKDAQNKANKDYEEAKKAINKSLQAVTKMKNSIEKTDTDADNNMKACNKCLEYIKAVLSSQNAAHAVHLQAIRAEQRQARSVAGKIMAKIKVVTGKANKGKSAWNEDTDLFTTDFTVQALANINFD